MLLKKLPISPSKYTCNSLIQYYGYVIENDVFYLKYTTEIDTGKILTRTNVRKAAGIDDFLVIF